MLVLSAISVHVEVVLEATSLCTHVDSGDSQDQIEISLVFIKGPGCSCFRKNEFHLYIASYGLVVSAMFSTAQKIRCPRFSGEIIKRALS